MRFIGSTALSALLCFSCLLLGLAMLYWGINGSIESISAQLWPTVPGHVISAQVAKVTSIDNEVTYAADIRYEYVVDGATLLGGQISSAEFSSRDTGHAEKVIAQYPIGKTVRVSYNPQNPGKAMLEPGFKPGLLLPLGVGIIFSLVGIYLCWRFYMGLTGGQRMFIQISR